MTTPGDTANKPTGLKMCFGCGGRICDRFMLHAVDHYWHTSCLKCNCCQAPLGELGSSCFTKGGMILCKDDYIRMFGSGGTCSSCGQNIPATELVMRVQGNVYHIKCFTCVTCHHQLNPGERFSLVNGSLLCEQDYPKVLRGHTQVPARSTHKVLVTMPKRKELSTATKEEMVKMADSGQSSADIARMLDLNARTVRRIIAKHRETGNMHNVKHRGRPRRSSECFDQRRKIISLQNSFQNPE